VTPATYKSSGDSRSTDPFNAAKEIRDAINDLNMKLTLAWPLGVRLGLYITREEDDDGNYISPQVSVGNSSIQITGL
jgi:hypothetical protein